MRVKDVMSTNVTACTPSSSLAGIASRMWLGSCGAIPVLDDERRIVGIVTDRDVCFAVASTGRPAKDVEVREITPGARTVYTCSPEDDVRDAVAVMRERRVRRLPVVDGEGRLRGMLSMTDAILHAGGELPCDEVLAALQALARAPRHVLDEAELHA